MLAQRNAPFVGKSMKKMQRVGEDIQRKEELHVTMSEGMDIWRIPPAFLAESTELRE